MLILIILPLLISGYCVQQWNFKHFYQLHRYTGQLLYLKSAFLGSVCLAVAFILTTILLWLPPVKLFNITFDVISLLSNLTEKKFGLHRKSLPFYIFLTSNIFIVAFLWSHISNIANILPRYFYIDDSQLGENEKTKSKKWEIAKLDYIISLKREVFCENPLDDLLMMSFQNSKDIMIHMSDKKVYIGFVMTLSEPNEAESIAQEIKIFPLKSGYRDKDNLTVNITTNYKEEDKLFIILRRNEIISATIYDSTIFDNFQKSHPTKWQKSFLYKEWNKFEKKLKLD
ncbi:hypothetical protein RGJ24_001490 [Acinetobacter baumannii]|nr:hypothetical protein [Acinetobacter baumannii]MDC4399564.1 hypothetical protein [Acinetobacter baumannii]MDC5429292.1 hypothetical protein [Acinetobacter baumannii]